MTLQKANAFIGYYDRVVFSQISSEITQIRHCDSSDAEACHPYTAIATTFSGLVQVRLVSIGKTFEIVAATRGVKEAFNLNTDTDTISGAARLLFRVGHNHGLKCGGR